MEYFIIWKVEYKSSVILEGEKLNLEKAEHETKLKWK